MFHAKEKDTAGKGRAEGGRLECGREDAVLNKAAGRFHWEGEVWSFAL